MAGQQLSGALKTVTAYGNFSKGRIDHDMNGRFDLPIYNTGMDVFTNFISNYKGNAIFSAGFLSRIAFQDCAFIEFKFGITQNYLCLFYNGNVQFLAFDTSGNFGYVLSGGVPLVVSSPYTLADAKFISQHGSYSQNSDVMYIAHRSYAPMKLIRVSASSFTLGTYVRTADPFTGAGLWPGAVCFYKGRLFFASTTQKLTSIWFSNIGNYDDFTIQSPLTDASGFAFTVTDITQQIEWLFAGDNSLIAGSTDGILAVNGGAVNTAITPSTVQANITSAEPTNGIYPLKRDGLVFYVGRVSRNVFYFKYDILTEAFVAQDANLVAYDVTRNNLGKIRFKHDRQDLIFSLRGDNQLVSFIFKPAPENINGWHNRTTPGLFSDIGVIGDNLGNPQLFALVNRGGTFYIEQQSAYVEFAKRSDFWTQGPSANQATYKTADRQAYIRYVSEQLKQCNYLDGSILFSDLRTSTITFTPTGTDPNYGNAPSGVIASSAVDFSSGDVGKFIVYKTATGYESGRYIITGFTDTQHVSVTAIQLPIQGAAQSNLYTWASWYKSFTTISGLSQFNGQTVGIVADGAFLEAVQISGGTLTLPNPATSVSIGYQYTGLIKSMGMGFQIQGYNTQYTLKEATQVNIRCVNTMGLKVGTDLYNLQEVQLRGQEDLNYLPPQPIDGTMPVNVSDDSEEDKYFYIVQDQPLPACITSFGVTANYALSS